MSFFIFTGVLISGAIFIAHYAANRFGFRLFYSSLVISALLALVINFVIISMKEVSSPESIGKILLVTLLSAAVVTAFNDFLTRLEKKKLEKRRHKAKDADEAQLDEALSSTEKSKDEGESAEPINERQFEAVPARMEDTELEETAEQQAEIQVKEEAKEENKKDAADNKKAKLGFIKRWFSKGKKEESPKKPDLSHLDTLDAILDFAYDSRLSGSYHDAVAAYEEAIMRYENDSYLPFIFIDLGNAHKEMGEYDAAIDVYEKAVNMEVIKKDIPTVRSFEDNTIYLKELKIALRKRNMEHTPFSQISKEILDEVDERVKLKEEEHEEKQ
ncbi:MAG: hypothetical protein IKN43_07570 [Selenomonadaceae bacterium]|nr:hypothetical protein [Selenomonadaceae bacterium]